MILMIVFYRPEHNGFADQPLTLFIDFMRDIIMLAKNTLLYLQRVVAYISIPLFTSSFLSLIKVVILSN